MKPVAPVRKIFWRSDMSRLDPLQEVARRAALVKSGNRLTLVAPLLGTCLNDCSQFIKRSGCETEIVMLGCFEKTRLPWHQAMQTGEEYRNLTRQSLISGQRPRFGHDDIGGSNVSMNVIQKTKYSRSRMSHSFNAPLQRTVPSTNNQDVGVTGRFQDRLINLQHRTPAPRSPINEYDARAIQFECGSKFLNVSHGCRNETGPYRHWNALNTPCWNSSSCECLERFIGRNKISIDVRRSPSSPKGRKRVCKKRVTRDAGMVFVDETLDEMIQHRMDGQDDIGALRFDKSANISANFRIKVIALIWPHTIDQLKVPSHPLRPVRQKRVVKTGQGPVNPRGFFKGFSNAGTETSRLCCVFNGGRRAVVSFPGIRGQD